MRPLAVLIGILLGSAVSLTAGLAMTWIVLLFLPGHTERIIAEKAPLGEAIGLFALLSAVAAASFYAERRTLRWRLTAHAALLAALAFAVRVYWPR